ncbi:hypothetical protein ACN6LA_000355 [Streptomyces sp. SAS_269]
MLDAAIAQSPIGPVEQFVVDQERVVLHLDLHRRLGELEQHAVVELDVDERAPGRRFRQFQQLPEEPGRLVAVLGGDDGVVERDCHMADLAVARARRMDSWCASAGEVRVRSRGAFCAPSVRSALHRVADPCVAQRRSGVHVG